MIYILVVLYIVLLIAFFVAMGQVFGKETRKMQFRVQRRKRLWIRIGIVAAGSLVAGVCGGILMQMSNDQIAGWTNIQRVIFVLCVIFLYLVIGMVYNLVDMTGWIWFKTLIMIAFIWSTTLYINFQGMSAWSMARMEEILGAEVLIAIVTTFVFGRIYMHRNLKI